MGRRTRPQLQGLVTVVTLAEEYDVRPGDYLLLQITGKLGFAIRVGQALAGDFSAYTHAAIVMDDGTLVAAQPGGARVDNLEEALASRPVAVSRNPLSPSERAKIVASARAAVGMPYSFLDYLSIVLLALRVRPEWLRRYVASTGHLICSQLVDVVYNSAGIHLFTDGRTPGDVTPGDLAYVGTIEHLGTGPVYTAPAVAADGEWWKRPTDA
jgi:hypothetical protein